MRHVQGIYSKRLSKDSTDYFDIVAHTGTDSPGATANRRQNLVSTITV